MISVEFYCFIYFGRMEFLSHKLSPCTISDIKTGGAKEYFNLFLIEKIILSLKARHQALLN